MGVGLYVHIPFCETKCGYCDFYSLAMKDRPTKPLVGAIVRELTQRRAATDEEVETIFVGGGTPTLLPVDGLKRLVDGIGAFIGGAVLKEFTVEANPASVDTEKIGVLRAGGVDRISMGAQSWHQAELTALERLHNPGDIVEGVRLCRAHDIGRINLDLIFGIIGQTMASWMDSLDRTIDLGVEHISCYALTYEPGTRLTALRDAGRLKPCDESLETEMYLAAIERLAKAGYEQYEISSFAQPGQRCMHNIVYWRNGSYVAVGPSAAGFVGGERYRNVPDLAEYVRRMDRDGTAEIERERITGATLAGETLMMGLRLNEGVELARLGIPAGAPLSPAVDRRIRLHGDGGLLEHHGDYLRLTPRGRLVGDAIISDLFAALHEGVAE